MASQQKPQQAVNLSACCPSWLMDATRKKTSDYIFDEIYVLTDKGVNRNTYGSDFFIVIEAAGKVFMLRLKSYDGLLTEKLADGVLGHFNGYRRLSKHKKLIIK
jgi:hypothetical protein